MKIMINNLNWLKILLKDLLKKLSKNNIYDKLLTDKLSSIDDSSKLFLYSKLKKEIELEEYLKIEKNFKYRQLLTKFRLSDHTLEVEFGRYKNIPRNQRLCKTCKVLEDEVHFFLWG